MIKHYCDVCNKEVAELGKLKKFELIIRNPRVSVSCEFCEECFKKTFPTAYELAEQKRVELNERKAALKKKREEEIKS